MIAALVAQPRVRVALLVGIRILVARHGRAMPDAVARPDDQQRAQQQREKPCAQRDPEPDDRNADRKVQDQQNPRRDRPRRVQYHVPKDAEEKPLDVRLGHTCAPLISLQFLL